MKNSIRGGRGRPQLAAPTWTGEHHNTSRAVGFVWARILSLSCRWKRVGEPWRGGGESFAHRLKGTLGKKRGCGFSPLLLKASFLFMEAAGSLLLWVSFCR